MRDRAGSWALPELSWGFPGLVLATRDLLGLLLELSWESSGARLSSERDSPGTGSEANKKAAPYPRATCAALMLLNTCQPCFNYPHGCLEK